MILNKKQTKKLIEAKKTLNTGFSKTALYTILDIYRSNIEYSRNTLSPSCFGVSAYVYSINNGIKVECEIRDHQEPDISENYKFKYCSLSVKKGSKNIYFEENTKSAQNTFLRMHELHQNKQH